MSKKSTVTIEHTTRCPCGDRLTLLINPPERFDTEDIIVCATGKGVTAKPDLNGIEGEVFGPPKACRNRRHFLVRVIVGESKSVVDMVNEVFDKDEE